MHQIITARTLQPLFFSINNAILSVTYNCTHSLLGNHEFRES